ncbi:MAG: thioredoxin [Phycisphaerae bacterium]
MAGENTLVFDESNFDSEVLNASGPVVVDFWAEWCGPCRALGPVIDELADDYAGKVKIGKLDIDKAQGIAARYNVMSIPTVIIFESGEAVEKINGAQPKQSFEKLLDARLV